MLYVLCIKIGMPMLLRMKLFSSILSRCLQLIYFGMRVVDVLGLYKINTVGVFLQPPHPPLFSPLRTSVLSNKNVQSDPLT